MKRLSPITFLLAVCVGGLWLEPCLRPAWACPMCSEGLSGGDRSVVGSPGSAGTGSALAEGFYYSILLMLAVPFSMMACLVGMLYWRLRKPTMTQQYPRPVANSP